jgi:hypothetical protein
MPGGGTVLVAGVGVKNRVARFYLGKTYQNEKMPSGNPGQEVITNFGKF